MWNMAKEGGWEAYEKITEEKATALKEEALQEFWKQQQSFVSLQQKADLFVADSASQRHEVSSLLLRNGTLEADTLLACPVWVCHATWIPREGDPRQEQTHVA